MTPSPKELKSARSLGFLALGLAIGFAVLLPLMRPVLPVDETTSQYYLRLSVVDRPGVMAKIARILGESKIGIASIIQPEGHEGESVPLILMIHDARNDAMKKALAKIAKLGVVKAPPVMFRVENFE